MAKFLDLPLELMLLILADEALTKADLKALRLTHVTFWSLTTVYEGRKLWDVLKLGYAGSGGITETEANELADSPRFSPLRENVRNFILTLDNTFAFEDETSKDGVFLCFPEEGVEHLVSRIVFKELFPKLADLTLRISPSHPCMAFRELKSVSRVYNTLRYMSEFRGRLHAEIDLRGLRRPPNQWGFAAGLPCLTSLVVQGNFRDSGLVRALEEAVEGSPNLRNLRLSHDRHPDWQADDPADEKRIHKFDFSRISYESLRKLESVSSTPNLIFFHEGTSRYRFGALKSAGVITYNTGVRTWTRFRLERVRLEAIESEGGISRPLLRYVLWLPEEFLQRLKFSFKPHPSGWRNSERLARDARIFWRALEGFQDTLKHLSIQPRCSGCFQKGRIDIKRLEDYIPWSPYSSEAFCAAGIRFSKLETLDLVVPTIPEPDSNELKRIGITHILGPPDLDGFMLAIAPSMTSQSLKRINLTWIGGDLGFPANNFTDETHQNLESTPASTLIVDLKRPTTAIAQLERSISSYVFDETVPADSVHDKPQLILTSLGADELEDTTLGHRTFLLKNRQWQILR